jgi:hypothetical protein
MRPMEYVDDSNTRWGVHAGTVSRDIYLELEPNYAGKMFQIWIPGHVVHRLWQAKDNATVSGPWEHFGATRAEWQWRTNSTGNVYLRIRDRAPTGNSEHSFRVPDDVMEFMFVITPPVDESGVVII